MVEQDRNRLFQLIMNIMMNALKFCFQGLISMRMRKVVQDKMELIKCSIADTGIGITEEVRSQLFNITTEKEVS